MSSMIRSMLRQSDRWVRSENGIKPKRETMRMTMHSDPFFIALFKKAKQAYKRRLRRLNKPGNYAS